MLRLLRPRALPDAGDMHGAAQALQRVHGPGGGQLQLSHVGHHSPGALAGQWEESRTSPESRLRFVSIAYAANAGLHTVLY